MLPLSVIGWEFGMSTIGSCWEGFVFEDPSITGCEASVCVSFGIA